MQIINQQVHLCERCVFICANCQVTKTTKELQQFDILFNPNLKLFQA